ncbi:MAG TPA: hypothetical protein VE567_02050 [Sphingomonas sp.]|nr:hypothetical protein [Sphingomonas sp.]
MRRIVSGMAISLLTGCASLGLNLPKTMGEMSSGYTYVPVDPLLVDIQVEAPLPANAAEWSERRYQACLSRRGKTQDGQPSKADLMDALPDHTIRMAIREMTGSTSGSYGPVAVGAAGQSYQVIVDSGFTDTTVVDFGIRVRSGDQLVPIRSVTKETEPAVDIEVVRLDGAPVPSGFEPVSMPIYVGVALRLTATLTVKTGTVDLGLSTLGAKAEAKKVSGNLVVQSLGIYGQQVGATFGIPNELNQTAIQNALVSLGAVKAIVYDRDTGTRPRITGIYNPLPLSSPKLINRIYAALASRPVLWKPCLPA